MTDQERREKVIKGLGAVKETLEDMRDKLGAKWCEDAIALLKAQEPVTPKFYDGYSYLCGACGRVIAKQYKVCPWCGRVAKWE